jgi:hypothetical protein
MEGETSFSDGDETVLYEGECMKYGSNSLRTFKTDNVLKGDYAVDVPGLILGVNRGNLIDFTDYSGTFTKNVISDPAPSEMGSTFYFNMASN